MACALMVLDAQRNMLEGDDPVAGAAQIRVALQGLLSAARAARATVVHVQNDGPADAPDAPHTPGWELVFPVADDDLVVRKDQADAFAAHPDLGETLRGRGVDRLVVAGMQSGFCVEATCRGGLALGHAVVLAQGAHATYDGVTTSATGAAAAVEEGLGQAGVRVTPWAQVSFG